MPQNKVSGENRLWWRPCSRLWSQWLGILGLLYYQLFDVWCWLDGLKLIKLNNWIAILRVNVDKSANNGFNGKLKY